MGLTKRKIFAVASGWALAMSPLEAGSRAEPQEHWAFQVPVASPEPVLADADLAARVRTPVDAFIFGRLESEGITPSPEADRRTLIRRAAYDLTGLPPSFDEVESFVDDPAPDAYEKLVDALLDSPRYGERWGRHWLDVARYADTKGYALGGEVNTFPFSYTYRDWVIKALNDDLPYDDFLRYQIAADRLVEMGGIDRAHLAALGFLTVGRQFLNREPEIIDDRIDVVTRGALGLTVACARCHDHKFDPVPTADYYSLYGIFASSHVPEELPEIGEPEEGEEYDAYLAGKEEREQEIHGYLSAKRDEASSPDKLVAYFKAAEELWDADGSRVREVVDEMGLYRNLVERWITFLKEPGEGEGSQPFADWRDAEAPRTDELHRALAEEVAAARGQDSALGQVVDDPRCPTGIPVGDYARLLHRGDRNELKERESKLARFIAESPGTPPRAMVLEDDENPQDSAIFERGNPDTRGAVVPRQFLEILSPAGEREPFKEGSGRKELAEAIADPANPLTARVMVDRAWMHHFGTPLVRTPGDFGIQCPPPVQLELLDYLAVRFMEDGWSLKNLHRLIVLSSTYRQSSEARPDLAKADPENDLYAKANRRRLDFEAMRDSLLSASGTLDLRMGGKPVDISQAPSPPRRTVYAFIDRQDLPSVFRTFDFASPDAHTPMRLETTVPQQALFVMNSPFVVSQCERIVAGQAVASTDDPAEKARQIYRAVLTRDPTDQELDAALAFVGEGEGTSDQTPTAWEYGYGSFDEAARKLVFSRLPHFTGQAWQGGQQLPDPALGWVTLSARGGHPGGSEMAAIRRWRSDRTGNFRIAGTFELGAEGQNGDGVRGRIVTDRQGVVREWVLDPAAGNSKVEAEVDDLDLHEGETVALVVDSRESTNCDSFGWTAEIRESGSGQVEARSGDDFSGPQKLSRWDQLAQVLVATNEFAFID